MWITRNELFQISDFTIVKIRNQNRNITQFFTVLLLGKLSQIHDPPELQAI